MPPKIKNPHVEFLKMLRDVTGYKNNAAFARDCGKQQANMHNYLNGKIVPQKKVLLSCLNELFARRFRPVPICEICKVPDKQTEIPELSGIYIIYDSAGHALYIGKADNFRREVWQTLEKRTIPTPIRLGPNIHKKDKPKIRQLAWYYSLYEVDDWSLRHDLEALLLNTFTNQTHNTNVGYFIDYS